jgi:hypothetical protein
MIARLTKLTTVRGSWKLNVSPGIPLASPKRVLFRAINTALAACITSLAASVFAPVTSGIALCASVYAVLQASRVELVAVGLTPCKSILAISKTPNSAPLGANIDVVLAAFPIEVAPVGTGKNGIGGIARIVSQRGP